MVFSSVHPEESLKPKGEESSKRSLLVRSKNSVELGLLQGAYTVGFGSAQDSFAQYTEKRFREVIVEEQTKQHFENLESLFYWIRLGDFVETKKLIIENPDLLDEIDPAGASVIHIAYLFERYDIGHFLVERFPKLALIPYSGIISKKLRENTPDLQDSAFTDKMMPYTGENLLHMTIIRRNLPEVRWLLDFYRDHRDSVRNGLSKLLTSNATGKFFDREGDFYFGGYPLQFAVCANHPDIFDLVLTFASTVDLDNNDENDDDEEDEEEEEEDLGSMRKGSSRRIAPSSKRLSMQESRTDNSVSALGPNVIFMRDDYGNTVLHLCVIHSLPEMYEHVYKRAEDILVKELKMLYAKEKVKSHDNPTRPFRLKPFDAKSDNGKRHGYVVDAKLVTLPPKEKYQDWLKKEAKIKMDERLVLSLNDEMDSPMTLAARIIDRNDPQDKLDLRIRMFQFLVGHAKQPLWNYGPVKASLLDLDGIEIKYKAKKYSPVPDEDKYHAAIDWLCINDADIAIQTPEIKTIIETKWERCGYPKFLVSFSIHLLLTSIVTLILLFVNVTPTADPKVGTQYAVNFLYPIVVIIFFIIACSEFMDFMRYRLDYFKFRGAARYDKIMRSVKVMSFVIFCAFKGAQVVNGSLDEEHSTSGVEVYYQEDLDLGVKLSLSVCIMSSWLHIYFFLMGFESTGPFTLTIFRIVSKDVPYFLRFYSIVVIAFACALSMLINDGTFKAKYSFLLLLKVTWSLVQSTVNLNNSHPVLQFGNTQDNLAWLYDFLLTTYYGVVILLMLNLLIAMISTTFEVYTSYDQSILLMEKYNIMHAMERSLLSHELKEYRDKYTIIQRTDEIAYQSKRNRKSADVSGRAPTGPKRKKHIKYLFEMQEVDEDWWTTKQHDSDQSHDPLAFEEGKTITLFIIDPQVDFHPPDTEGGTHPGGTLAVSGANEDSQRIADMIKKYRHHIHDIFVSLDSHYPCHVAHAISWKDEHGNHPDPFTTITHKEVMSGKWLPTNDSEQNVQWVKDYTKALEGKGRMQLTIWPEHCIIGSMGHSVVPVISDALQEWAHQANRPVNYVMKGQNLRTEMYSALEAEVEDPLDVSTALNSELMSMLQISDRLLICGQALSHCVNYTLRDIMKYWHGELSNLVLLTDGSSPVLGFKASAEELIDYARSKNVTISTTTDVFSNYEAFKEIKPADDDDDNKSVMSKVL